MRLEPPPRHMKNPQAHHDLPQAFKDDYFGPLGLDIDDPAFTRWVEGSPQGLHQNWSGEFNDHWRRFFDDNPVPTREQVVSKMLELRIDRRFQ